MKIAIAGYGVEGKANFSYWNRPENDITIVDERESLDDLPENVKTLLGPGSFEQLRGFDLVVRTAGLAPHKIKTDGKIWSSTNEFFAKCPAPIIGVTGTKGKGTTCSLIASILEAAGKTVHLVGNIGTAALNELPKIQSGDIVVFELSSFQLWDIQQSPHIAVLLMIEADHLNVHNDMPEYISAKANITKFQTDQDTLVFNQNNEISTNIAAGSRAQKVPYPFDISEYAPSLNLPGKHNEENASAAIAAVREYVTKDEAIRSGLSSFKGLPHRLERIRVLNDVTYYNDSFSSAPGATVAAIRAFTVPEVLIIGGIDKGSDFQEMIREIKARENVKEILLIGEIRTKLAQLLQAGGLGDKTTLLDVKTMPEIVAVARGKAEPGDVVLLSPACASFDMFDNFYDRGDQFRDVVNAL